MSSAQAPNPRGGPGLGQRASILRQWLSPGSLRTVTWVSVITVLVWIWADLERPSKTENLEVWVKVVPAAAGDVAVVNPAPGPDGLYAPFTPKLVRFTLRGPRGKVGEFARKLRENKSRQVCIVQAEPTWEVGKTYTLNTLDLLNGWDLLREEGLTAEAPSESSIAVKVDRWVELPVKVAVRTNNDDLVAEKSVVPKTVNVRVLSSNRDRLGSDPAIQTVVYDAVGELKPGESKSATLELIEAVAGIQVKVVGPRQVTVNFRAKEQDTKVETKSRKVAFVAPLDVWQLVVAKGYLPQTSEPSIDLKLRFPREKSELLDAVRVYVEITADDAKPDALGKTVQREVSVFLPPGVELVETPPPVDVKLYDPKVVTP